ncbi:hypothetical protein [Microbacterium deminutum]|uniref:Tetrapyrrole biosynthesis glutamyl-tRNA reductase dimerisation domain-containing protein n=1 Tax=Microbacterium deminutum TaxID=344164 RepID=A0ABP5BRJ0_9MICO
MTAYESRAGCKTGAAGIEDDTSTLRTLAHAEAGATLRHGAEREREMRTLIASDPRAAADYYRHDSERTRRLLWRAVEMLSREQIAQLASFREIRPFETEALRLAWKDAR